MSKLNSAPTEAHLTAVGRLFRYLKGTQQLDIQYQEMKPCVEGYSDADWASDKDNRRSASGNVYLMCGGAISWMSQQQPSVALSTSEAEYIALCSATQEAVWLRRLMKDFNMDCSKPLVIHEDNQGTIALPKKPAGYKQTKHIDIKYQFCPRDNSG